MTEGRFKGSRKANSGCEEVDYKICLICLFLSRVGIEPDHRITLLDLQKSSLGNLKSHTPIQSHQVKIPLHIILEDIASPLCNRSQDIGRYFDHPFTTFRHTLGNISLKILCSRTHQSRCYYSSPLNPFFDLLGKSLRYTFRSCHDSATIPLKVCIEGFHDKTPCIGTLFLSFLNCKDTRNLLWSTNCFYRNSPQDIKYCHLFPHTQSVAEW